MKPTEHAAACLGEIPLIAILRGVRPQEVLAHAEALLDAGIRAIEVPLNSPDWTESVQRLVTQHGREALIGGGTVLQTSDVDTLAALGAAISVSPNTRPAVIRHAAQAGLLSFPGIATASEAFDAIDAGAFALKLFPAAVYGPALARALRAVLPPLPLYAVGGVRPETLSDYLDAGCDGAGLGGELYRAGQSPAQTAERARAFVRAYHHRPQ